MASRGGDLKPNIEFAFLHYSRGGRYNVFTDYIAPYHALTSVQRMKRYNSRIKITSFVNEDRESILPVRSQQVVADSSGTLRKLFTL